MPFILRQYEEDGHLIVEYTKDGITVSHVVKTLIPSDIPTPEPIDVKLDRIETKIQTDNATQFDVLATVYEEMTVNNTTQFDVAATMYEEIVALRAEVAELKGGTN